MECRTFCFLVAIHTQTCTQTNADILSNGVMHMSVILDCSEPVPKHSRGIRQTPHAPQADEADTIQAADCFQQTLLAHDSNKRGRQASPV